MYRRIALMLAACTLLVLAPRDVQAAQLTTASVQQAIQASITLGVVPSDVNPPLADTATEKKVWFTQGISMVVTCDPAGNPAQLTHPVGCVLGDTASPKVMVLFGDSNAASWIPALDVVAKQRHYRLVVFVYPGCGSQIPLPTESVTTTTYDAMPAVLAKCAVYHQHLAAAIQAVHPVVLISAHVGMDGGGTTASWATYAAGWKYTFDQVSRANPHAMRFLMETTPNVGRTKLPGGSNNIATCLSVHPTHLLLCSPSYIVGRDSPWSVQTYRDRDAYAAPRAGATLIPTVQWFCRTVKSGVSVCPAVIAHRLIYVDQDHVSIVYMHFIAGLVQAALVQDGLR
jgi:hypothetical protein